MRRWSLGTLGIFALCTVLFGVSFMTSDTYAQYRGDWRQNFYGSREGWIDEDEQERAVSRRGLSSAIRREIDRLDDDPVEGLPIPILFGVTVADLWPNFGDPRDGGSRSHQGQDIMAPVGAYVVSPTDAVVTRTGNGSSAGTYVYTANPGGETFAYMHLDEIADGVEAGTVLEPGDLIGYVGNTGNASGGPAHLHFEIREGRSAVDPYPRLVREFTLEERIAAVEHMLDTARDEEDTAAALVDGHRSVFIAARAAGIDLPQEITDALGTSAVALTTGFSRDLDIGATGADVAALQTFLIALDTGPQARALAAAGATGYFGTLTRAALAEYQAANGITPAVGYFGPITRAFITGQ